jgi:hypothetical protein
VYGFDMIAIRVKVKDGGSGPQQIDNLDGRGLDFQVEWRAFFQTLQADHMVRARRYWQTTPSRAHRAPGSSAGWTRLDVEYGPNGIPGRVFDTDEGRATATVRPQDATVHRYRHLLARPRGGTAALLAAEVVGRSRAHRGPTDAFRKHFETCHTDFKVDFEYIADGEYWEEFLEAASLVSVTLTRQTSIPGYLDGDVSGQTLAANIETTIKAAGRGHRLPASVVRPLLERRVNPRDAFGVQFDPDRTCLQLEASGQTRRVYLEADETPSLVYPIGDPDRPDQPADGEFVAAATETTERLLAGFG